MTALLDCEDYRRLQIALMLRPEQGPVIRGAGGLRQVLWATGWNILGSSTGVRHRTLMLKRPDTWMSARGIGIESGPTHCCPAAAIERAEAGPPR